MAADPKLVRDLFLGVAELPVAERAAFLNEHCADPDLRAAALRLLAAHEKPASILDAPAPGLPTETYTSIAECVGAVIGPYKLMEQIGEGALAWCSSPSSTNPSAVRSR
jgi:hypothetical protein